MQDEYGSIQKVSYGRRVLKSASAITAEREALKLGIEHLTMLFPTEVTSFDFQVENAKIGTSTIQTQCAVSTSLRYSQGCERRASSNANRLKNRRYAQQPPPCPSGSHQSKCWGAWARQPYQRCHQDPSHGPNQHKDQCGELPDAISRQASTVSEAAFAQTMLTSRSVK